MSFDEGSPHNCFHSSQHVVVAWTTNIISEKQKICNSESNFRMLKFRVRNPLKITYRKSPNSRCRLCPTTRRMELYRWENLAADVSAWGPVSTYHVCWSVTFNDDYQRTTMAISHAAAAAAVHYHMAPASSGEPFAYRFSSQRNR